MYLDIFICVLLLWAVISGWRNGFVKEAFSTVGLIVGLILAGVAYLCFGEDFLAIKGSDTNMVLSIGAFILLWICLPLFLGLLANILTKAIKGMSLGVVNSLLGVGFSVLKFVLLISCVLNMMAKLNIADQKIMGDSVLLAYQTSQEANAGKFKLLEGAAANEEFAIGLRKGETALAEAINAALVELAEEGKLAEISTKWFGSDITLIGKK